jgi:S1 RNA binding domain/Type I restriction enzyme R protein N terminus (HSDR_N)
VRFQPPKIADLKNESDVETKFLLPLMTSDEPHGLGIPISSISGKVNLRKFRIGKGSNCKIYFPDFLVVAHGLPIAVIEAKAPDESVDEGFREARLYACELNAVFSTGINSTQIVIATNGDTLAYGLWDQDVPLGTVLVSDLLPQSESFRKFQLATRFAALEKIATAILAQTQTRQLKKPRRLVGGSSVQQEDIGHNSFGATISADLGRIFNPNSRSDRSFIARFGYIPSLRRQRYVDPIDRVIRASKPPSEIHSIQIENTSKPAEVIGLLRGTTPLEHQVLLIVGSVGSGKTTFIDHLEEVALPRDLMEKTLWVRFNMNSAPISETEIYDWIRQQIINEIQDQSASADFENLATLEKLYSVELNRFKKGRGQLFVSGSDEHNRELARYLEGLEANLHGTAVAYTRYCATERGKLLVMVFDNCDKRLLNEQLLMFQTAQWVQKEFRALVILPLREETYDNYRDRPPLDTALKDLVFRIEPPLFQNVLVTRVQLALNEISKSASKTLRYELPNGFHVEYPAADQAYYLTSILSSIFEHDRYIRRMITGLAGRNLRRALEIFLEFCNSGHIGEDEIFRIRQSEGKYTLPLRLVTQVLLRLNRRFYDSDHSYIKNLFDANRLDSHPVHLARLIVLRWLREQFTKMGPSGMKGYFSIGELKKALVPIGITEEIVSREVEYLARAHCITSEDFRIEALTNDDLIRLAPAGFVHLELVENVTYLAAAAEDTAIDDEQLAKSIANRISTLNLHYDVATVLRNAEEIVEHLCKVSRDKAKMLEAVFESNEYSSLTDLSGAQSAIRKLKLNLVSGPWAEAESKCPTGAELNGAIVNRQVYGIFVELDDVNVTGLVHKSRLPNDFQINSRFLPGEQIRVKVRALDPIRQRMELEFVGDALF